MATLCSKPTDVGDSHYTGLEPEGEPRKVSVRSQGVLREDSDTTEREGHKRENSNSSDQQIAELPAKFMLVHLPPTVPPQGTWRQGCESLTSNHSESRVECDGGVLGTLAASPTSHGSRNCRYGVVSADSECFYLNDTGKNGGQVGMNTMDGSLSISDNGELFKKVNKRSGKTSTGCIFEVFALQSSTSDYFLAVDTRSNEVKGITERDMRDPSNCWWRMQPFNKVGKSSKPNEFALQYWGAGYGRFNPDTTDGYYFIIKIQQSKPTVFIVADKTKAAVYGRFSYSRP